MIITCANCKKSFDSSEVKFCSQCGEPVSQSTEKVNPLGIPDLPFWKRDIGVWALAALLSLLFYMFFVTVYSGKALSTNEISNAAVWPGIAGAYVWRKQKKSGWAGFGFGIVCGLALVLLLSFVAGFIRPR